MEPRRWRIALVQASFGVLFALLSPIYYLNRWDFKRKKKRNPFYTSALVRLQNRYPLLYELSMLAQNFPMWHRVYDVLPTFSGDVLQVGCGTGLLNKHMQRRADVRFTNMDANADALRVGASLGRYSDFVHAYIDRATPLPDRSFDVVLFARSFHHVRNHRKAFVECERLLRDGGIVIIADPVMLQEKGRNARLTGYMANSSIDGVIWRFTRDTFLKHLEECLPPAFTIRSVICVRQLHVTNYNMFVPQTDIVAVLVKGR
jgi:SAM-dependent methyltransferase